MQVSLAYLIIFQKEAAIVSEIAGTTRDVIEVHLNIDGISCNNF